MGPSFKDQCAAFRSLMADMVLQLSTFKDASSKADVTVGENRGEVLANITLALRHVEDASMRLGKVIQAHDRGISPLGGPSTPGASNNDAGIIGSSPERGTGKATA